MNNLEKIQRERQINEGLLHFTRKFPNFFDCDANVNLVASAIEEAKLPLNALSSWQTIYENIKDRLATKTPPAPERAPEEEWSHPFPKFTSVREIRRCPPDVYRAWYFDRTEKGEAFRNMVNNILDEANGRKS